MFMCSYSGQQCCEKDASDVCSIFHFEIEGFHPSKEPGKIHKKKSILEQLSADLPRIWSC